MKRRSAAIVVAISELLCLCHSVLSEAKRPIVPSDCVTVRYLLTNNTGQASIQLNRQGTLVAYLVKSPNLAQNENDIELYVKDVSPGSTAAPRLLLSGSGVSQLQWLEDGIRITVIAKSDGRASVVQVDVLSGEIRVLARADHDIREYSIDSEGREVVFAMEEVNELGGKTSGQAERDAARGYRIPFEAAATSFLYRRSLYVIRIRDNGTWTKPEPIIVRSPFTGRSLTALPYLVTMHLSLSPDGRRLLVNYIDEANELPHDWQENDYVKGLRSSGFPGILLTLLVDLVDGGARLALKSPWISNTPLWSTDSQSFIVSAISPVGSQWDENDRNNHRIGAEGAHLFYVEPNTRIIEQVVPRAADAGKQPLSWNRKGELILHTTGNTIGHFLRENGQWKETDSFQIPLPDYYRFAEIASDGKTVIGDHQNAATAPEIFLFRRSESRVEIADRLNPQLDHLSLAPLQPVRWTTSTGYEIQGFVFTPPGYQSGVRYPLVIQTKPDEGQFVCDTGQNHYPSFAPQPIANAGMMYLVRTIPEAWKQKDEEDHYPAGYPGGIGEAAFQADIWESAVKTLDGQGIIDPERVGIIGFSRSGWYTSFALTHSSVRYRAATIADNVEYSLAEYWLHRRAAILRGWDTMYGGPPFGTSLKNWLNYSISFNVDKIHTPVLMEEMGYGVTFDDVKAPPLNLAAHSDLFTGMNRLHKPVELYFYPAEGHQPDHPQARLATLQRNLDWYRFWLQDYERPNPEDPDQYLRWRRLRELQRRDRGKDAGTDSY